MPKKQKESESAIIDAPATVEEQIDVVMLTSDALSEVNLTLAAMLPSEPGFEALVQKRDELEVRLKRLVREFIKDNTERFVSANSQLVKVKNNMIAELQRLENMKDTIDSVTNLIKSLDSFINIVFPIPA